MAFKSHAHKNKMAELVTSGHITQKEYDRHHDETEYHALPERVTAPPKSLKSLLPRRKK